MSDDSHTPNAYLERQRQLARERQRRSRDRRRNGHVTRMPLDDNGRPSPRLAKVAQGILEGKAPSKALVDAGFPHSSHHLLDKIKPILAEECKALGLTRLKVLQSTVESIDATSPTAFMVKDEHGVERSIERPDWTARAAGRRDAIALLDRAGELPSPQQVSGNSVSFHFHVHQPQDVVDDARVINGQLADGSQPVDSNVD